MKLKVVTEQEVRDIASELREIADKYPMYPDDMLRGIAAGRGQGKEGGPHPRHKRQFSYEDRSIQIMFTLTVIGIEAGASRMYQLSCGDLCGDILPEKVVDVITTAFFSNRKFFEIPSILHGTRVRQFLQQQEK